MIKQPVCWCGNHNLSSFSKDYLLCERCKTLVLSEWPQEGVFTVEQDHQDFYGKSYWFEHQENDLQFGNIIARARTDIPERILYWLGTLLKYKLPPGETLELGCSHGGFVSVLQWAGFQASGLELSPWVVDFARQTFQIPMYQGRLEDQNIRAGSLDAVILMDVLEHLPDPVSTISTAAALLKEDGVLIIQTPCYPEGHSFESLQSENSPFLLMFQPPEHVYLFSQASVQQLLRQSGLPHIQFEHPYFDQYDMFLVAGANPFQVNTQDAIGQALTSTPHGRLILALLDKDAECRDLSARLQTSEADGAARLDQVNQYAAWLEEAESDRAARLDQINQYDLWLKMSQAELQKSEVELQKIKSSLIYKIGKRLGMFA